MAGMDPPLKLGFAIPYIFTGEKKKKKTLRTVHRKLNACVLSHPKEVVSFN